MQNIRTIIQEKNGCQAPITCIDMDTAITFTYDDMYHTRNIRRVLTLVPIGSIEDQNRQAFENLFSNEFIIDNLYLPITYNRFYEKCKEKNCQMADVFYVTNGPEKITGKYIMPYGQNNVLSFIEVKLTERNK